MRYGPITAQELRDRADDPTLKYIMHRHDIEHGGSTDCECAPLTLTYQQIYAYHHDDLEALLRAHYAVH